MCYLNARAYRISYIGSAARVIWGFRGGDGTLEFRFFETFVGNLLTKMTDRKTKETLSIRYQFFSL